jgi:hypothetical protein
MLRFSVWMVARGQQETLEAFDKFITACQMRPGSLEVEKLCLPCGIGRVLGAPPAVGRAVITLRDMLAQFLKHHAPPFEVICVFLLPLVNINFDHARLIPYVLLIGTYLY